MADRLSIEGLRYARAVSETGSFSAAARSLSVSQPGLSNGIATLEQRLGERLFERSTRGAAATAFGEQVLPLVDTALIAVDAVTAQAARWTASGDETIRMGVSPLIASRLVAAAYDGVCCRSARSGPRQLVLREANMTDLRDRLVDGALDLILIPSVAPLPRYEHRIIASEPLVVVEPGPGARPVDLAELSGRRLILMPDTCGLTAFTNELIRTHDLDVTPYAGEAASYRVLEEWAQLGLGSALVPRSKVMSADTACRPLCQDGQEVEIFYAAVWDPNSPLAGDLEVLADRLASTS